MESRDEIEALKAERKALRLQARKDRLRIVELERDKFELNKLAVDRRYFMDAYRNMLGPIGLQVAKMWSDRKVQRVHFSWGPDARNLTGEQRAKLILEWDAAPRKRVFEADL